jgi:hypothetical protein
MPEGDRAWPVRPSHDLAYVFGGHEDGYVVVADSATGAHVATLVRPAGTEAVERVGITISVDDRWLFWLGYPGDHQDDRRWVAVYDLAGLDGAGSQEE